MSDTELHRLTAEQAVQALRSREVSPREMVHAAAARIEAVDGVLNALPTRCIERALQRARALEEGSVRDTGDPRWLAGLPVAVKDLNPVAGVRTTYGSPIYAEHVPSRSDLLVERLEANGAIVIAKSNTPEFAAGASTFNPVLGRTCNPWNPRKSVAGSSGDRPRRWPRARSGWRRARIWAAACAPRRPSTAWSGCARDPGVWRGGCSAGRIRRLPRTSFSSRGRWRAPPGIAP